MFKNVLTQFLPAIRAVLATRTFPRAFATVTVLHWGNAQYGTNVERDTKISNLTRAFARLTDPVVVAFFRGTFSCCHFILLLLSLSGTLRYR